MDTAKTLAEAATTHMSIRANRPPRASPADSTRRVPLVVHVIHRLNVGGLENGLVNLINHMPEERMHHAVICLTDYSDFSNRIRRRDVPLFALHKPAGNSPRTLYRLWKLLRKLRPDILHTRNLGALEGSLAGALAGVRSRIHGEHGRDSSDLDGNNVRHQVVRRLFKPFVHRQIALSKDLEHYLEDKVRVPHERIVQLYNGVDTMLFHPPAMGRETLDGIAFAPDDFVIGTIGRMHPVKDQLTLARAFVAMHRLAPDLAARLKLVMVGEGPLRAPVAEVLRQAGLDNAAWLPGERDDVPRIMRGLDLFVLPSLAEGISNTILEAMATGLPVVATAVGGNPELLDDARTGTLVPRADPEAMAQAMLRYATDPLKRRRQGLAARARVESEFSMNSMVNAYLGLYEQMLNEGKV